MAEQRSSDIIVEEGSDVIVEELVEMSGSSGGSDDKD